MQFTPLQLQSEGHTTYLYPEMALTDKKERQAVNALVFAACAAGAELGIAVQEGLAIEAAVAAVQLRGVERCGFRSTHCALRVGPRQSAAGTAIGGRVHGLRLAAAVLC